MEKNIVIVGANGSGKSRLGRFIGNHIPGQTLIRISAQRLLRFEDYSPMMSYTQSLDSLMTTRNVDVFEFVGDYQQVLSTLFASSAKRDSEYVNLCKDETTTTKPLLPESAIEKVKRIWEAVFPHRVLFLEDNKINAALPNGEAYSGKQMSDGEKVALYLIGQCLIAPENYTLIIDEPELHLHKALMDKLWDFIELERQDCSFIYITHNLDFAATRKNATKIWVKSYVNNTWNWEIVPDTDELPENLVMEVLGSTRNVLFTEGEKGSYDEILYNFFYSELKIIPRGACESVKVSTMGINANFNLHGKRAIGLVDKDFKNQEEIDFLKSKNVFTLEVAEVENLFLIPEIIYIIGEHLGFNKEEKFQEITSFIIDELEKNFNKEISYATSLEVNYKLNILDTKREGVENIKNALLECSNTIDVESIYNKYSNLYQDIIDRRDYKLALKHFNHKGLLPQISRFFGLGSNQYSKMVIRLLKTTKSKEIKDALKDYLPTF